MPGTTAFLLTIAALAVAAALSLHRHVVATGCVDDCARLASILRNLGVLAAAGAVAAQTGPHGILVAALAAALWAAGRLVGVTTYQPRTDVPPFPPEWIDEFRTYAEERARARAG